MKIFLLIALLYIVNFNGILNGETKANHDLICILADQFVHKQ